jgi:predicted solute-binding protein
MRPLRFGTVDYINTLPLTYPVDAGYVDAAGILFERGVPAAVNTLMKSGSLDCALVSTTAFLERQNEEKSRSRDESLKGAPESLSWRLLPYYCHAPQSAL